VKIVNEQFVISYMQITAPGSTISPLKYCGEISDVPQIMTFDTELLILTFVSDNSVSKVGFKVTYKVLTRKGLLFDVCHHRYHSSTYMTHTLNNLPLALQQATSVTSFTRKPS